MRWLQVVWLRMTGRYNEARAASMRRHPAGKRVER